MNSINKKQVRDFISEYSKRTSIGGDSIDYLDKLWLKILNAIVTVDNRAVTPDSGKKLTVEDIEDALMRFDESHGLVELLDMEMGEDDKDKIGALLLGNQEIDINLHLSVDLENGEINQKTD